MAEDQFTFRGQREDEEVLFVVHQHPWALAKTGLIAALGLAIIVLAFVWFQFSAPTVWTALIVGVGIVSYVMYHWFVWWNNLYILTNQRVIVISQRQMWSRRIEDYNLTKIQSVASAVHGLLGSLMNFGEVSIVVNGLNDPVILPFVEDPRDIQEKFLDAIQGREGAINIREYDKPAKRLHL